MNSNTFAVLLLVATMATVSLAIVCPPNACEKMRCAEELGAEAECMSRGEPGRFRFLAKGGFCGCCGSCVTVLKENENCVGMLIRGVPARVICDDGLVCDREHVVCRKME